MTHVIGVYGAGGCGRGIMPLVREQYPDCEWVFVDDGQAPSTANGHKVITWDAFIKVPAQAKSVVIAIADPATRSVLAEKVVAASVQVIGARDKSVIEMDEVAIAEGACLSPHVTLTSNIRIGRCFHANLYSYIEHDCVIGDFVTLAPGAKVNGNVTIGDHAYIGTGAIIRQGLSIGAGAVVGMGAVVTKDVPPGVTVVGNPAKPLIKA